MTNLIIGNKSQLSYFFPIENHVRISSRNLDLENISKEKWDRVYLCFGESRKFISNIELYDQTNFEYTLQIIEKLKNSCNKIIVYSTCELWNKYTGAVTTDCDFSFFWTPYLLSKYKLSNHIIVNRNDYQNVILIYPFNFNSTYRTTDFLFGKIFDSIINKRKIEIGDTYFFRDIIHPKYVAKESTLVESDSIIGSGRKIFVNDFIRDLYDNFDLEYDKYVSENLTKYNEYEKKNEYYLKSKKCLYTYKELLEDTIEDIKNEQKKLLK
jgi:nucleoside-diphosphate-sugar epimerase